MNSTHARLNLHGWNSGGCPITSVILEYRPRNSWQWQSLRANVTSDVFLTDLREATWYELKMRACNSAGCGNETSQFATLDYDGSKYAVCIKSVRYKVFLYSISTICKQTMCNFFFVYIVYFFCSMCIGSCKT